MVQNDRKAAKESKNQINSKFATSNSRVSQKAKSNRSITKLTATKQYILVFGMHRSGTSALASILMLMGASGPKTPLDRSPDNPKGYGESARVISFHEELLAELGARWDDWLPLDLDRLSISARTYFNNAFENIIADEYDTNHLSVIKDPRMCRLAEFWIQGLSQLNIAMKPVLILRNPLESALSLKKRDNIDISTGLIIWLHHILEIERVTRGQKRAITTYANLLKDWRSVIRYIETALDIDFPNTITHAADKIDDFLDPDMQHHAISDKVFYADPQIPQWVSKAYKLLLQLSVSSDMAHDVYKDLDDIHNNLQHFYMAANHSYKQFSGYASNLKTAMINDEYQYKDVLLQKQQEIIRYKTERYDHANRVNFAQDHAMAQKARFAMMQRHFIYSLEHFSSSDNEPTAEQIIDIEQITPLLDERYYLEQLNSLGISQPRNLGLHYLKFGGYAGLNPHPYFDSEWYRETYADAHILGKNPLIHYLNFGYNAGYKPHPLFDSSWYAKLYKEHINEHMSPLQHFIEAKNIDNLHPNGLFDGKWYLEQYPDVAQAGMGAFEHFVLHGDKEYRNPHPEFDSTWYADMYLRPFGNPIGALEHYFRLGQNCGLATHPSD